MTETDADWRVETVISQKDAEQSSRNLSSILFHCCFEDTYERHPSIHVMFICGVILQRNLVVSTGRRRFGEQVSIMRQSSENSSDNDVQAKKKVRVFKTDWSVHTWDTWYWNHENFDDDVGTVQELKLYVECRRWVVSIKHRTAKCAGEFVGSRNHMKYDGSLLEYQKGIVSKQFERNSKVVDKDRSGRILSLTFFFVDKMLQIIWLSYMIFKRVSWNLLDNLYILSCHCTTVWTCQMRLYRFGTSCVDADWRQKFVSLTLTYAGEKMMGTSDQGILTSFVLDNISVRYVVHVIALRRHDTKYARTCCRSCAFHYLKTWFCE